MNKSDVIKKVSERTSLTQVKVKEALVAILDVIGESLAEGEDVTLVNFGTFKVVERKERKGNNPATGKQIVIPYAKLPKFVPGKLLKEAVDH